MKKLIIFSLCAVAAMAAVSCSNKENAEAPASQRVPATINAVAQATSKMTIDALQTSWEAGDAVSVFDIEGKSEGRFTASAAGTKVAFGGTKASEDDLLYYAIYPANDAAVYDAEAATIKTTIPCEQDGTISSALAFAQNDGDDNFVFYNVTSVVKFTIPETETDIEKVIFVADSSRTIAGDVVVKLDEFTSVASEAEDAAKYAIVVVTNGDKPLTPGDKYISVLPGTCAGTLVFAKKDGSVRYAAAKPVSYRTYKVNTIKNLGTANITWVKGAAWGVYSVAMDKAKGINKKVLFAQGNVQYNGTTGEWRISSDPVNGIHEYNTESWIEHFFWNNADIPTGYAEDRTQKTWSEAGDWSKKIGAGWSMFTQAEANFIAVVSSGASNHRESKKVVSQAWATARISDANMKFCIWYPDGYPGPFLSKDGFTEVTEDELNALQDKGCVIIACDSAVEYKNSNFVFSGNNLGNVSWLWTQSRRSAAGAAAALRFNFTSTNEVKTANLLNAAYNVRPMYEIK